MSTIAARIVNVGQDPGMFSTVEAGVAQAALMSPSYTDRVVVQVWPGHYEPATEIQLPAFVNVESAVYSRGFGAQTVNIKAPDTWTGAMALFRCGGDNMFGGLHFKASLDPQIVCISGEGKSRLNITDCTMGKFGKPGRFFEQVGDEWSILTFDNVLIDAGNTAYAAVFLHNTSGGVRQVDTEIVNCFWDSHNIPSTGAAVLRVRGCSDVRIARTKIRAMGAGGTGLYVTDGNNMFVSVVVEPGCYFDCRHNSISIGTQTMVRASCSDLRGSIGGGVLNGSGLGALGFNHFSTCRV